VAIFVGRGGPEPRHPRARGEKSRPNNQLNRLISRLRSRRIAFTALCKFVKKAGAAGGIQTFARGIVAYWSSKLPSPRMSVRLLKRELRRGVQGILKSLTTEEIVEECISRLIVSDMLANRCAASLFQLPQFVQSRNVSVYLSMPSGELQTSSIIEKCFQLGRMEIGSS
jgi:hypothetical protein